MIICISSKVDSNYDSHFLSKLRGKQVRASIFKVKLTYSFRKVLVKSKGCLRVLLTHLPEINFPKLDPVIDSLSYTLVPGYQRVSKSKYFIVLVKQSYLHRRTIVKCTYLIRTEIYLWRHQRGKKSAPPFNESRSGQRRYSCRQSLSVTSARHTTREPIKCRHNVGPTKTTLLNNSSQINLKQLKLVSSDLSNLSETRYFETNFNISTVCTLNIVVNTYCQLESSARLVLLKTRRFNINTLPKTHSYNAGKCQADKESGNVFSMAREY
jgi:hypothetical protein